MAYSIYDDPYVDSFDVRRHDVTGNKYEPLDDYVNRMRNGPLPHWPVEVLTEWFFRHAGHVRTYAFLKYELFQFKRETWPLSKVPGREAYEWESTFDEGKNIEERAENPHDWLANYMLKNGTWNTPVILLDNPAAAHRFPDGPPLKSPYHLLEGHRRLAFLGGLRELNKANSVHAIWLVTIPSAPTHHA